MVWNPELIANETPVLRAPRSQTARHKEDTNPAFPVSPVEQDVLIHPCAVLPRMQADLSRERNA